MKTVSINLSFNCALCLACKFRTYNKLSNKCLLKWAIYWWLLFPLGLSSNIIKKYRSFEIYNSLLIIFSVILVIQYNKILKTHVNLSTFLLFNIRNILCLYDLQKKKFKFKRKFPNISNWNKPLLIKTFNDNYTYYFYKQLGSSLSPQSYLYFKGFWGSKLCNGCLVVWSNKLCLRGMQKFSGLKLIFIFSDFKSFPVVLLSQLNCGLLLF